MNGTSAFPAPQPHQLLERFPRVGEVGNSLWVAPYLVGLGVISYIGAKDYDGTSLGLLPFGWDVLVMAVFSLVIYYFALSLRLSAQEAEKSVSELGAAGEAEPR